MREIPKNYDHKTIEKGKYAKWKDSGYFTPNLNSNKPTFSMVLPPPNVTGASTLAIR